MAFDYKKEYKEFYLPKAKTQIISIPEMQFVAVCCLELIIRARKSFSGFR